MSGSARATAETAIPPGTRLGPYEVLSLLGAGGMGQVYRARDARLGREVAIKVLHADVSSDADRVRRFEQEARAVGALSHPNLVAVFDTGLHAGAPYVVFELLQGETLRQSFQGGAPTLRKRLEWAAQIAEGLAAAHEAGIVHRDLKPENIFVTREGRVKILDFGLAKLRLSPDRDALESGPTASALTDAGTVMGTVGYMSPEQVRGRSTDHRSDIFSFGVVVFEILTLRRAFQRATAAETMTAILREDPVEGLEAAEGVPPGVARLVRRCLEKSPEHRFQSARDIAFALEALGTSSSGGVAVSADAPSARRRVVPALLVLGLLVLPAVTFLMGRRIAERPLPSFRRLTFRPGAVQSARFSPDGRSIVYSADFEGGPLRVYSTRVERPESTRVDLPDAAVEAISATGEMLVTLGRHLHYTEESTLARVPLTGGAPRAVAEHIKGADWGKDGSIALVRQVGDRVRLEYPVGHLLFESEVAMDVPRVSPDGNRVAFFTYDSGTTAVAVVDRSGVKKILSKGWKLRGKYLLWSPAGDEVWFAASQGGFVHPLRAVTLSGRERVLLRLPGSVNPQDVSSDGRVLLSTGQARWTLKCLPSGESRERDLSLFEASTIRDLTPDGGMMLFAEAGAGAGPETEAAAYIRKTDGSPPVRLADGTPQWLSPDGRRAIVRTWPDGRLHLVPTGPGEAKPLDLKGLDPNDIRGWYGDNRRILLSAKDAGGKDRCYSLDVLNGQLEPATPEGFACAFDFGPSPGDAQLLVTSEDGQWRTYAIATGETRPVAGIAAGELPLQWGADGHSLFVLREPLPLAKIDHLDLRTGQRRPWREIALADPAGLVPSMVNLFMARNGSYCYSYLQQRNDLYLVEGIH